MFLQKNIVRQLTVVACALAFGAACARATETENQNFRLLPAPPNIKIDGKTDDWDLAAGIFATGDAENLRDRYAVWLNGAYDANNLYILARFIDDTPLNNPSDTKLEFGWSGDCLQVRIVTNYGKPNQQASVANAWKGRDGRDVVELDTPGFTKNSPKGDDIKPLGAQQAFAINEDGHGYVQEIAIPWKFLTKGDVPKAGDSVVLTFEPNFTTGANSRMSIKDVFRPGATIDRVFTFTNKGIWGVATLLDKADVQPVPVRLSDGRTFPVSMQGGVPVVDWTGLVRTVTQRGFKPIEFSLPQDGIVSLIIKNEKGEVVRHLLNAAPLKKGENTVSWDGLADPIWRTPAQPVAPGNYTWNGIWHTGIGLKWRGTADNAGNVPWDNGPGTNWGGDMGAPGSVATEGKYVLLGWDASEAGKAAALCDLNGKVLWNHKRGGFGGAPFVGLDGGVVYIMDYATLYKLDAEKCVVVTFTQGNVGELTFASMVGEANTPAAPQGMAVRNGKLYLSSSDYSIARANVTDWRALLTKSSAADDALWENLSPEVQKRIGDWLKTTGSDNDLRATAVAPDARDVVVTVLNTLLDLPKAKLSGSNLRAANRQQLEAAYGLPMRNTGFVAVVDAASGKLQRKIILPGAGKMAADATGAYVLVDGSSLVYVNGETGALRTVLKDVPSASSVAVDGSGNLYIGARAPVNQVLVYSPQGKLQRTIGKKGGRAPLGPWQADALLNISAVTVDGESKLWVGEGNPNPKRFTSWNAQTGELVHEYFGPTRYGASGGAIHPADPNVMVGEACEWKLDPVTGAARCVGVFDTGFHAFARFCKTGNGRDYLAVDVPSYIGGDLGVNNGIKIYERLKPGVYRLRSTIYVRPANPTTGAAARTEFWADSNDDQQVQPNEVQVWPGALRVGGYYLWSMYVDTDLTFNGAAMQNGSGTQFKVSGYSPCGAPIYDVRNANLLPTGGSGLSSLDGKVLLASGQPENGTETWSLYDMTNGSRRWSYYNGWSGVHGSHVAPPPETGLIRGAFGIVGTAKLPEPLGDIWAINSNVGEWHLLTRDGYYLSRLFESDPLKIQFPAVASPGADVTHIPPGLGGEDFGGSLVQGADGKVYVQAGKTALWNMEMTGLDSVKALPGGNLQLSEADIKTALNIRGTLLQEAAAPHSVEVHAASPTFTGNPSMDFKGAATVVFQKSDDARVRSYLAYDAANLYLAWDVADPTPWTNAAKAPEDMYLSGDTVDFQLGADPKLDKNRGQAALGDLRISIGNFAGQDTAVIYRKVSTEKKPKIFSSGVVREYPMDYVSVIPDAKITVAKRAGGYIVEAAIPFTTLGIQPAPGLALRGDLGVTHGDPGGTRTRLRTYWSNQETGIVDDAVYELMMNPKNWGEIVLK